MLSLGHLFQDRLEFFKTNFSISILVQFFKEVLEGAWTLAVDKKDGMERGDKMNQLCTATRSPKSEALHLYSKKAAEFLIMCYS